MREIRQSGSEGGAASSINVPTPIKASLTGAVAHVFKRRAEVSEERGRRKRLG
jgi:hypothetical protein